VSSSYCYCKGSKSLTSLGAPNIKFLGLTKLELQFPEEFYLSKVLYLCPHFFEVYVAFLIDPLAES